jgi:hypothetical protein
MKSVYEARAVFKGGLRVKTPEILEKNFSIRKFAVNIIGKAHKIQS